MTLSTTANKVSYVGDGTTISFAIPFLFIETAHVEAVLRNAAGVETIWALNTQYTLTGAGLAAGGTLTVSMDPDDYTPAVGETLVIRRVVPETQETDYPEGGAFPAAAHEQALDKLTMLVQQHSEEIARAPVLPVSSSLSDITIPEPGASELIRWNAAGTALETVDATNLNLDAAIASPALGDRLVYNGTVWANRADGVVNVFDHGATGDGTTDDAAAIQAAIDTMTAGGILFFPPGTYLVDTTISVLSNILILGSGPDASIVKSSSASVEVFEVQGSVGASLSLASDAAAEQADIVLSDASSLSAGDDLLITGDTSTGVTQNVEINRIASIASNTVTMERNLYDAYATANSAFVQKITLKTNVTFRDLTIQSQSSASQEGIDIDYAKDVLVENCRFVDCLGLHGSYSENVVVRDSRFRNMLDAVTISYSKFGKVLDCHIDTATNGVVVVNNSDGAIIRGNTIKNVTDRGVNINSQSQDALIDGNTILHFGDYGILTDFDSDRPQVVANTVRYSGSTSTGIHMGDANYGLCQGNHISEIGNTGIAVEGGRHVRVIGNLIENIGTTTSHPGINISGSAQGTFSCVFSGNTIVNCAGTHIIVPSSAGGGANNIIEGNTLRDINFRGIVLTDWDYTTCRNNTFEGTVAPSNFLLADTQSLTTLSGDGHITTGQMDLSGADTGAIMFFMPATDVMFYKATVMVTESTSADDGVRVYVTSLSQGGGGSIVDFEAGPASLLKSLAAQSAHIFVADGGSSQAITNGGDVAANDVMYYRSFGGKTGTGEITIQLDYISLGSS